MTPSLETQELLPFSSGARSRRMFLVETVRALSLATVLAGCADEIPQTITSARRLTSSEARTMRVFAARIIPSDDGTPGADEARAAQFAEHAMGMAVFGDVVPIIHAGLSDLDARARALGGRSFTALALEQQIAVMRQIEHTKFFASARRFVVMGMLADSKYGGNANGVGWAMIGIDHRPSYEAPFGWYDAQARADSAEMR